MLEEKKPGHFDLTPKVFAPVIRACIEIDQIDRAWATFRRMQVWHCEPDTTIYNIMIYACAKVNERNNTKFLEKRDRKSISAF